MSTRRHSAGYGWGVHAPHSSHTVLLGHALDCHAAAVSLYACAYIWQAAAIFRLQARFGGLAPRSPAMGKGGGKGTGGGGGEKGKGKGGGGSGGRGGRRGSDIRGGSGSPNKGSGGPHKGGKGGTGKGKGGRR